MRCPRCASVHAPDSRFCSECGTALLGLCEACGRERPADQASCSSCGAVVPGKERAPAGPLGDGRYRIQRKVGAGSRKVVYLARDLQLGRDVVVSVLDKSALDDADRERVRREARAMALLGRHPHVVPIYDVHEADGGISIIGEWVPGGDLEQRLACAESGRLPVLECVRVARDVARGLAHVHTRGVVHRDVKPSNIFLGLDGAARLGDFGLALCPEELSPSTFGEGGRAVGTVAYMPPEQALGDASGPRSDLYGLGATLFELLVGEPPFSGGSAVGVLRQHLEAEPSTPSARNSDVPPELDDLVLALLEKRPEGRPASAALTAERLDSIATAIETGTARRRQADRAATTAAFVGRENEMARLGRALSDALAGRRRIVAVTGDAGMGKTRLLEEAAALARMQGARVVWGRAREAAPAYWPWSQLLGELAQGSDEALLREWLGDGAGRVAGVVPELRTRLPDVSIPSEVVTDQARLQLSDAISRWLRRSARARPLVAILDDLHWADPSSLRLLEFLARGEADVPLLVLTSHRPAELEEADPRHALLAAASWSSEREELALPPLGEADISRLVLLLHRCVLPASLAHRIHEATDGNAFVVREVVRLLEAEDRFEPGRMAVVGDEIGIPSSGYAVVERRLSALPEAVREVLGIAAVVGLEFEEAALAQVLGQRAEPVREALDRARSLHLIQRVAEPGVGGRYRFEHALVRDALRRAVDPDQMIPLHLRIAEVLEEQVDERPELLGALSEHLHEALSGSDPTRLVTYASRAAEAAAAVAAFDEAAVQYERACRACELDPHASSEHRAELLLAHATALGHAGQSRRATRAAREAAELARKAGRSDLIARAAVCISQVDFMYGGAGSGGVRELIREAFAIGGLDPRSEVKLGARLAYLATVVGDLAEAASWVQHLSDRFGQNPDPEVRGWLAVARTQYAAGRAPYAEGAPGFVEELRAGATELEELSRDRTDSRWEQAAVYARMGAALLTGDAAEVERTVHAVTRLADRTHVASHRFAALVRQTMWCMLQGRIEEGERLALQSLALAFQSRIHGALHPVVACVQSVRVLTGRGDELVEGIRWVVTNDPDAPAMVGARGMLAVAAVHAGRFDEAREQLEVLARDDFALLRQRISGLFAITDLADVVRILGDRSRARKLYDLLVCREGVTLIIPSGLACFGAADLFLGILATTLERFADAERHFLDATDLHRRLGARPLLARTHLEYARLCLARAGRGDLDRAIELSNRCLKTSRELSLSLLIEQGLTVKLEAQGVDVSNSSQSIHAVASQVGRRSEPLCPPQGADGSVTLLFSDLERFTRLVQRLGDQEAHRVVRIHNAIVREQVTRHAGFELEIQGDGFLLAFPDAPRGVRCAIDIQRALARHSEARPEQTLRARMGLHTGPVIRDADAFFGSNVILAYRIADQARGEEILVSERVARALEGSARDEFRVTAAGRVSLKGFDQSQQLHSVAWR